LLGELCSRPTGPVVRFIGYNIIIIVFGSAFIHSFTQPTKNKQRLKTQTRATQCKYDLQERKNVCLRCYYRVFFYENASVVLLCACVCESKTHAPRTVFLFLSGLMDRTKRRKKNQRSKRKKKGGKKRETDGLVGVPANQPPFVLIPLNRNNNNNTAKSSSSGDSSIFFGSPSEYYFPYHSFFLSISLFTSTMLLLQRW